MQYVLASSDPLAPWGQAAAIVLLLYFLIVVLLGLGLTAGLMFGLSWVRDKTELIKKLRPTVESVNTTTEEAIHGNLPAPTDHDNKIIRTIAEVPARMHTIEEKVDEGSEKVTGAVIEFRARTQQVKTVAKALFLPGLMRQRPQQSVLEQEGVGFKSPGYRMLVEENAPAAATGDGTIRSSEIKDAPVEVVTSAPYKDASQ